jgi:molecular chaperone GrpE (heat shock protein)
MIKYWPYTVALAAGLSIGWIWNGAVWGERYAQLERDHAQHIAAQQAASADVISRTLLRERDLQEKIEESGKNAQAEKEALERELADSNAVASRMRERLDDISRRVSSDTAASAECTAARDAAGVFAELLGELDQLAGAFAESADRSRIAGQACEAVYDTVREASVRD